jgi:4-alpha-glucanotransferase
LADEIVFREYLQWIADQQWRAARRDAERGGVVLFGDVPFMVALDSADVWARQDEFRLDTSVGVPPDAFSAEGQDWKLPAYNWDVIAVRGFDWLRRCAGYRVDHLVGYYRTFFRPLDGGPAQFSPADEASQTVQGERVLGVFRESGAEVIAEDLGTVPDFVRASMARLEVPGCKVMRWERAWHAPNQPFLDPEAYPTCAMATSGTHDTEPVAEWWTRASQEERTAILAVPSVGRYLSEGVRVAALSSPQLAPPVRDALLRSLVASAADLVILPMQDVFGLADRINQPAVVDDVNWTWRLPWPSDALAHRPAVMSAAIRLREWALAARRTG